MSLFSNLSTLFATKQTTPGSTTTSAVSTDQKTTGTRPLPPPQPLKVAPGAKGKQPAQKPADKPTESTGKGTGTQPSKTQQPALKQPQVDAFTASQMEREAQSRAREIIVEAKAEALSIRSKAESQAREISLQIEEQQKNIDRKLDKIDQRLEQLDERDRQVSAKTDAVNKLKAEIDTLHAKVLKQLEDAAGLTANQAKQELLDQLEKDLTKEMAHLVRQREEEAEAQADEKVQEILLDAMKHGATDYVAEYTVSVVQLPSEDAKGKIIGKSGRNINAFERATGVDVDLDMSPTEVRLSCFDPVRREVARISLERLIKDGRIQPARIEEVVAKVRTEIDKVTFEAGKQLCHDIGIYNLPVDLMKLIGKFKYRFSYGQNLIAHTLEETKIGMKLASELGLNVNTVKLGCLLHDIGKVSEEAEGSHVELGIKIAKRFNMPQDVIDCIAQHHEDEPFSGPEQMAVYIADAISGARPGARYENYDEYVARLTKLEEIATAYPEVKLAYAIQAGREVRVLLAPEKSKDDDVLLLSKQIRDEIKEKVTYPGTVTVTVIRETRGKEVAQ